MTSTESAESEPVAASPRRLGRGTFLIVAGILIGVALIVDPVARAVLSDGQIIDLGVLELRLAYNSGVAFSLGAQLPAIVIVAVTATITATIGVYAWRTAPEVSRLQSIGLAAIVAGAAANVIDRILDGKVTDYFHTGWWPTFNLADVYITGGVVLVMGALIFANDTGTESSS